MNTPVPVPASTKWSRILAGLAKLWAVPIYRAAAIALLVGFGLGLWAGRASAGEASFTWVNPVTRVDGTALSASELRGSRLERGTCVGNAFGTAQGEQVVAAGFAAYLWTGLPAQVHCFRIYARASSIVAPFIESVATNPVIKTIDFAAPSPATNPVVLASTVFSVIKQVDRFVLLPVGTAPPNTPCISAQSVNGYYVVPRTAVTWFGSVRPDVVVAQCG